MTIKGLTEFKIKEGMACIDASKVTGVIARNEERVGSMVISACVKLERSDGQALQVCEEYLDVITKISEARIEGKADDTTNTSAGN